MGHKSRWVLPTIINPPTYRKFVVCVPNERFYVAAFQGLLIELTYSKNWQRDPTHKAALVSRVWQNALENVLCDDCGEIIKVLESEYEMAICEQLRYQDGKLQGYCCGEWVDIEGQTGNPPGGGTQPGGGTEQPPAGECLTYHASMTANNKWYLPTVVSAGDVITVSNLTGAGNDGTLSPWHCPDGDTFFAGACIGGTGGPSGGDPDGSANHMELVMNIGGTWYEPVAGAVTVPGGVSNAEVYFQVNDSVLSDNAGSYVFDVEVCNNQDTAWIHVWDFTLTNGGWTALAGGTGVWVPGAGWKSELTGGNRLLAIGSPAVGAVTFTNMEVDGIRNAIAGGGTSQSQVDHAGVTVYDFMPTAIGAFAQPKALVVAGVTQASIVLDTSGNPGVDNYITKAIAQGLGVDPF